MTNIKTTQRAPQTKISSVLATLLVSAGFVMTLPVSTAYAQQVQCDYNPGGGNVDCTNVVTNTIPNLSVAGGLSAGSFSVTTLSISTLNATTGNVGTLTATTGNINTLNATTGNVGTLTATTGNVQTLNATTGNVGTLTATTGNVGTLNATTGNVQTLNATTGNISTLNATTGNVGTLNATTGNVGTLTATNGAIQNLTVTNGTIANLQSVNINTVNLTAGNANITNLAAGNINATNLTATSATISNSLVVKPGATIDMGGNRVQGVVAGVTDTDAANMGQLRSVEKMARQQGAIAAAATAIPLVVGAVGETTIGAGIGASGGQGALAVGLSSRISEDLILKANAGVSGATKSIGVGIGYTFK